MLLNSDCDRCFCDSLVNINDATSEFTDNYNQQNLALVGARVLFKNYNKLRPTYGSCGESLSVN